MTTTDHKSIDPRSLTPSEAELLDQVAMGTFVFQPGNGGTAEGAYKLALEFIAAKRALFAAPQPETEDCSVKHDGWWCSLPAGHEGNHIANDGSRTEGGDELAVLHSWPQVPAPCPTPEAGAASEMDEAVKNAVRRLRVAANDCNHYTAKHSEEAADALEAAWRSQPAKPTSVGMSPELESILSQVTCTALHFKGQRGTVLIEEGDKLLRCVAAVRLQASQPVEAKRVRLTKTVHLVRKLMDGHVPSISLIEESEAELNREGIEG